MRGTISSSGWLASEVAFPKNGELSSKEQLAALAITTAQLVQIMLEKGIVRLYSSSDLSNTYGNSRQYWEKLLSEGKLPFQQTSSGRITTNLWVEGYLDSSTRNSYPREVLEMRRRILSNEQLHGGSRRIRCVRCNGPFEYYYNQGNWINGICSCGFRLNTVGKDVKKHKRTGAKNV